MMLGVGVVSKNGLAGSEWYVNEFSGIFANAKRALFFGT